MSRNVKKKKKKKKTIKKQQQQQQQKNKKAYIRTYAPNEDFKSACASAHWFKMSVSVSLQNMFKIVHTVTEIWPFSLIDYIKEF